MSFNCLKRLTFVLFLTTTSTKKKTALLLQNSEYLNQNGKALMGKEIPLKLVIAQQQQIRRKSNNYFKFEVQRT